MIKQIDKRAARHRRHRRVRVKVAGSEARPRLTVFRSLAHTYAQVIDDATGRTLASSSTLQLGAKKNDLTSAAAVGKSLGEKARAAGIASVVFDRSGYQYHGRIKALADAAREAGLEF